MSSGCLGRRPPEVGPISPHPMKYDGELARDSHDRLLHAPALRYAHAPGLECTPATARAGQQHERGLVEGGSHHSVPAFRHAPDPGCLAGLVDPRREPVMRPDALDRLNRLLEEETLQKIR